MLRGGVASADASPSVSATRERGTAPKALDDIDFDIKQATANADNNSTWNFMIASALQVVGHCRDLPPDVVEYGLRTKRIPPDKAPRPQPRKANGDIKAMDGAEREFAAPAFDDDELDLLGI